MTVQTARLLPVDPSSAEGKARDLLESVNRALGLTPNMMRTMALSPAALDGYLALNGALSKGFLPAAVREQLALAVAETNHCDYCLAAHTALGARAGLTPDQVSRARKGQGGSAKIDGALRLARELVDRRGDVADTALDAARRAGLSDAEIVEVVGHVALNVFTNYLNLLARTEIDFPRA